VARRVAVVGTGYVGLTTGACLAHLGHDVVCADVDAGKVERLSRGEIPIVEHDLDKIVARGLSSGRLRFVLGAADAVKDAEIVFICVPTPQDEDGSADLSYVEAAAREIATTIPYEAIVVNKSTVPVGSTRIVAQAMQRPDVKVVSNPEFLREGSAVQDFLHPDRIVVGSDDHAAAVAVADLYGDIIAPRVVTDPASAETIKYAANAFLATKLSFVNAVAAICEGVGADVNDVVLGIGYDKRIGHEFLKPGPGWGGSCFDGEETLMVRSLGEVRMIAFRDLQRFVDDVDLAGVDVLSWAPGAPRPEFQPLLGTSQRSYEGEMVHVRTKMGRRVLVTVDHPFVAKLWGGEPAIVNAGDLAADQWLPVALGEPTHDELPQRSVSMIEAIEPAGLAWGDVIVRLSDEGRKLARREDHALPANRRYDSRRTGAMRLTEAALLRVVPDGLLGTTTNGTYVPAVLDLDEEMWEVIGLYLAEGHIGVDGQRQRVCWSFHPTEETHLAEFVAAAWRKRGVKTTVRRLPTTLQVSVSSRLLAALFRDVLTLGHDCYSHRIPDLAWTASEAQRRALLRGLWLGDGSWSKVAGGPSVVLEYGTVSRALADGMLRLLGELGIVARMKVARGAKSTVDTYFLCISGADQIEKAMFLLEPDEAVDVQVLVDGQAKRIAPTGYRIDEKGTAWVRVTELDRFATKQTVYSAEVAHNHTIVTSFGLVAHNCFPKDTHALINIADNAGYEFHLLRGVIAVNDEQFERVVGKIADAVDGNLAGRIVGVWGLTFKARTDDLRESPSLEIIKRLIAAGATVQAFDPTVSALKPPIPDGVTIVDDAYAAAANADVLAVLTEWDDFRWLDAAKVADSMSGRTVVDSRNLLDRGEWHRAGFTHLGIGR
jgi:UDPglucose 6-dehydrogenase